MSREWLRRIRLDYGLTLQTLSKRAGISWQSLAYYESGERTPSVHTAKNLASILAFDWTRFYTEKDVKSNDA